MASIQLPSISLQNNLTKIQLLSQDSEVTFDARIHEVQARSPAATSISLVLRDEGSFVAASVEEGVVDNSTLEMVQILTPESIVRVSGNLVSAPTTFIQVSKIVVLANALADLPKGVVSHGAPGEEEAIENQLGALVLHERLNNRVADVKVAATGAIFKLLSGIFQLAVEHQTTGGFHWVSTPGLINYRIPGDDDYFPVSYFDNEQVWLAQTGEFHLQIALAMDFKRVFEIRDVFRRERKVSSRHLTEYTALEVMMAFEHDWQEILYSAESLIVFIIRSLQQKDGYRTLINLAKRLYSSAGDVKLGLDEDGHFPRLKFVEAKGLLHNLLGFDTDDRDDFTREEEAALSRLLSGASSTGLELQTVKGLPTDVFAITDWPPHLRPFNVQTTEGDEKKTNSFDIIVRGQETCSGWQSIHSYNKMRQAMAARDPPIDPDASMWHTYIGAYEAGAPPQGGYGMGLNRLLQNVIGLSDIHEAALFPRNAQRVSP
ncbi:hypothetical protein DL95DRAFT_384797 [Leptodontidium sp. 2 PMI_412]|nr:hypothetical protein DL95DRAFT_384797 [Leptodontidium sp. 2 PMI_412]